MSSPQQICVYKKSFVSNLFHVFSFRFAKLNSVHWKKGRNEIAFLLGLSFLEKTDGNLFKSIFMLNIRQMKFNMKNSKKIEL
jgi:hypothetical protein